MSYSMQIETFLNMLKEAESEYNHAAEQVELENKRTSDYLHKLELEDMPYNERAKLSTKLKACRKRRRKNKDVFEELEPVVQFVQTNQPIIKKLEQTLGAVRKQEKYHENRQYFPRTDA